MMRVLHVGCGLEPLPDWLRSEDTVEVRVDIDPAHKPDVIASMTDLGDIGEYQVLYTCHALEHIYPHEVPVALAEFLRVLCKGGYACIVVPNLDGLTLSDEVVYSIDDCDVTVFDMFYGHRWFTRDNPHMAHKCGFTSTLLRREMESAGFTILHLSGDKMNLVAIGLKAFPQETTEQ